MNYKIIGIDGKTYGPTTAEQIRQWIVQGRIESQTPVFVDGASEWTFIGLLPEFAKNFPSSSVPVTAPPKPVVPTSAKTNGFATAGFVCGLLSLPLFCCCCGFPFNVLGVIFSITALVQINGASEKSEGRGLAIAGLICSAVSLLLSFGFGLLQIATSPARSLWHLGQF